MDVNEIIAATGGPNPLPAQPTGDPNVTVLNQGGLDKTVPEEAPSNVNAQQGAGQAGSVLTPAPQGTTADGTVEPGNDDHYSSQGGPEQLQPSTGLSALTPDPSHGRPDGGADHQPAAPEGHQDDRLGPTGDGTGLNPALGRMPKTPPGSFGPSTV